MKKEKESRKQCGTRKSLLCSVKDYVHSHMWFSFAVIVAVTAFFVYLTAMFFLRYHYYNFLMQTTFEAEERLLDAVENNIQTVMEEYISIGASICVDETLLGSANLLSDIEEYVNSDQDSMDEQNLKSTLKIAANISSSILGVAVIDEDGVLCQYDKYNILVTSRIDLWNDQERIQQIFDDMSELNASNQIPRYMIITDPYVHPNVTDREIVTIAFPLREGYSYEDIPYVLLLTFYTETIEKMLQQLLMEENYCAYAYIADESGTILMHTDGLDNVGQSMDIYEEVQNLVTISTQIGSYGWNLYAVIDKNQLKSKVDNYYHPVQALFIGMSLLIFLALIWAVRQMLRPIYMIGDSISKVRQSDGGEKERIPINGTNEAWQLAESYNLLLDAIDLADQRVKSQHEEMLENIRVKHRAEQEALESQINAHFICNTLNAINYEAIESGNYKISILLKKLSNILRYTFDQKNQDVYMRQEIVWVEQYLYLQQERLESVFTYEISFDPDYDDWPCRKLMLQPFVENSITHGFEGMLSGGEIKICGEGCGEFLRLVIEDNGRGMDKEQRNLIQEILRQPRVAQEKGMGIGISNVITRMRMYYGEKFNVTFESEKDKGTRFTFYLPIPPGQIHEEGEQ